MGSRLAGRLAHLLLALAAFTLLLPADASAMRIAGRGADRAVLTLVTGDGAEHRIEVLGWQHEVISPRDAASGLPTGKRRHKPFTIIKGVDASSPMLALALLGQQPILSWRLEISRALSRRRARLVRTVDLVQPTVCAVATARAAGEPRERELVSFCYQRVIWTWQDGGVLAEDDWETPID